MARVKSVLSLLLGQVLVTGNRDSPPYPLHLGGLAFIQQMALWKSQREDHTSDWLRAVHISGLGQTMNACSKVFVGDIYGDRVVSCVGIIGLDVCVDLTRSSPFTQIEMADFVPSRVVIDVAQRKCVKYMAKCAAIGYGFLPFSFSSLGKLEDDAVTLLKRIRKFSMAQELGH
ncbi:hypothetical protein Tco_0608716 [Tanacetum coccineum]